MQKAWQALCHQLNDRLRRLRELLPALEEKVRVLLVEQRHLALIDPVRVYHNAALLFLTENVRQTYRGDYPALQDVA